MNDITKQAHDLAEALNMAPAGAAEALKRALIAPAEPLRVVWPPEASHLPASTTERYDRAR